MPGRVRTRRQFALFATPTGRGQSGPLRISFVAQTSDGSVVSVAYATSRKGGNAVERNRLRRRLRAVVDQLNPQPLPGLYLIRCGVETGQLPYEQLEQHLHQALDRAGAFN